MITVSSLEAVSAPTPGALLWEETAGLCGLTGLVAPAALMGAAERPRRPLSL